ncbi:MAG: VWA domain-containing protein [Pseudomonadota bacterium]
MAAALTGPVEARQAAWQAAWPAALAAWSRFTRLHDARLCGSSVEAAKEGLAGSFAMIRLLDKSVVVDLEAVGRLGLDDHAVEILAHEIGHHVLAPASATDSFRLIARIRKALPTLERHAPMVANLFTDLLINDRLQRQAGLSMIDIYARLAERSDAEPSRLWTLYMGICESLWQAQKGSLGGPRGDSTMEGDAWLGARLIRVYAGDWMTAAGRFATLVLPYLADDIERDAALRQWHDTRTAAEGCDPSGAQRIEPAEADGAVHPSRDPLVTGVEEEPAEAGGHSESGGGQMREPFEYGELIRAAGLTLSDEAIAIRYYRERALPFLVDFPTRPTASTDEPQLEGLEPWEIGDPLDEIDWLQTLAQSPVVVPGLTTVRRTYGREPGRPSKPEPIDLDLYVDSSGSMPDPRRRTSFLTLAGAIVALSALKVGAAVQATLWSGKDESMATDGFVRDEKAILGILTGFYGGATAYPIHRLRETYAHRPRTARPVHILMISDDGITTMFDPDERGTSGWEVSARALAVGRAGGTMALNLWAGLPANNPVRQALDRARDEQGWAIHGVTAMEELVAFAHAFSRRHYTVDRA